MDILQDWMINVQDYIRYNPEIAAATIDTSKVKIVRYISQTGVYADILASHLFVLEFDPEIARNVNTFRLIIVDLLRAFVICLYFRITIQWFGITPYDNGIVELVYSITTPYVRFFIGYFPSLCGVDIGHLCSFALLDYLDRKIMSILIVDHNVLMPGIEF